MDYIEILRDKGLLDLSPEDFDYHNKILVAENILNAAGFLLENEPLSYYYNLYQQYGFDGAVQFLKEKKGQLYKEPIYFGMPNLFYLAVQKSNIDTAKKLEAEINFKMHSNDKTKEIFDRIVSLYSPDIWFPLVNNLYLVGLPEEDCREIIKNKDPLINDLFYSIFGSDYKLFEDILKDRINLPGKFSQHITADDVDGLGDLIIELSKKYGADIFNFFTEIYSLWMVTPKEELEGLNFKEQLNKLFYSDIYNHNIDPIYYPLLNANSLLNHATNEQIESVFDKLKENPAIGSYFYSINFDPRFIYNEEMMKWFQDYVRKYGVTKSRIDILKILGFAIKNFHLFLNNNHQSFSDFNVKIKDIIYLFSDQLVSEDTFKEFFIETYNLESIEKGEIPFEYAPILMMSEVPISKGYIENNLELFKNARSSEDFTLACFLVNLFDGKKLSPDMLGGFAKGFIYPPKNFNYDSKQAENMRRFLNAYSDDQYNLLSMKLLKSRIISDDIEISEEPSQVLLENADVSLDVKNKILNKYKNDKDVWPFLIEFPNLTGLDANLIRKKMDEWHQIISSSPISYLELINILALFGNKIDILNKYFKNKNSKIDLIELIQCYHDLISMLPEFEDSLIFKHNFNLDYIDNFILKYFNDLEDSLVKISLKYWSRLPIELKKTQDKNTIFQYIKNEILPESIGGAKIKHENLFLEAFKWNHLDDYTNLEKLYDLGQIVSLPEWTNIGVVDLENYKGYFAPRSDARAMFIGNYITCCQQIGGQAEKSAIHSQVSPFGALFLVENKKKKTLSAQSWVWSNGNTVVFDNIESPSGKMGASYNEKAMNKILDVYKTAAKRISEITKGPVFVGHSPYGISSSFYDNMASHRIHLVPEDSHVFLGGFYPKDRDFIALGYTNDSYQTNSGLYLDSYYDKRRLANNIIRIIRMANKIDSMAVDLSDNLERLFKNG